MSKQEKSKKGTKLLVLVLAACMVLPVILGVVVNIIGNTQ